MIRSLATRTTPSPTSRGCCHRRPRPTASRGAPTVVPDRTGGLPCAIVDRADAAFLLHPQPQFAGLSELRKVHPQVQEIVVRIVRGDHVGLILGIAEAMEHDLVATDDPIAQRRDRDREEDCNRSTSARSARSSPPLPRMLRPSSTQRRTAPA